LNFNQRVYTVLFLSILLIGSAYGAAEPGGNGDATRDMQCGGACHGDAALNETSLATLTLSSPSTVYAGIPTTLTLTATNLSLSSTGVVGFFLLTDTTGHSDTPQDAGWEILSDSNGGSANYVEQTLSSGQAETSVSWVVRSSNEGFTPFYAAIHHGGSSKPFFAVTSTGYDVEAKEIPENLPRLAADFIPQSTRILDVPTVLTLQTEFTESVQVQWKVEGGAVMSAQVNTSGDNLWSATLPAALQPATLQWRAVLQGEGPDQTTPWFTLTAEEAGWEIEEFAVYLQAFSLLFLIAGAVLALQSRLTPREVSSKYDQTDLLPLSLDADPAIESVTEGFSEESETAPLPAGGLPNGWNEDQWKWYGHDYLAGKYGGGQE
jgi:hypothetical protein